MDLNQGNIATIGVMIWTIISPYIAQYVSQEVFLAIFGLIIVIWSAYNPNTMKFFNNQPPETVIETEETVLNDEYECDDNGC